MSDDVLNFDDFESLQNAESEAVKTARATAADFKAVFESEAGQRVLKKMKKFCFLNQSTFDPNNHDLTVFREGMRNVTLWIKSWLEYERDLDNAKTEN